MTTNILGAINEAYKPPKTELMYGDKKPHVADTQAISKETESATLDISTEGFDLSMLAMYEKQLEAAREQGEAMEESVSEMGKILMVFQRLAHGDNVPQMDEQKLMEYDDKMYQVAKNLQRMAQQMSKSHKDYESLWEEDDGSSFWSSFGNSDSFASSGIETAPAAEPAVAEVAEAAVEVEA